MPLSNGVAPRVRWSRLFPRLDTASLFHTEAFAGKTPAAPRGTARFWWGKGRKWKRALTTLHSLRRTSTGNKIDVFYDTGDAYRAMWSAVDGAASSIKWQTYICKDDNVGRVTMQKLEAAQRRGVAVELLYDTGGNITGRAALVEPLRRAGATVIAHRSFVAYVWHYLRGGLEWENSPAIRNHRKILVVDGAVAFAGGLNIGDDYCSKDAGGNGRFRDTMCRVVGPAVRHLEEVYEDTKTPAERGVVRLRRWRHWLANAVREARAKRRVTAVNASSGGSVPGAAAVAASVATPRRLRITARFFAQIRGSNGTSAEMTAWRRLRAWTEQMRTKRKERMEHWRARRSLERAEAAAAGISAPTRIRERAARLVRNAKVRHAVAAHFLSSAPPLPTAHASTQLPRPPLPAAVTQILSCNPQRQDWGIQKAFWVVVNSASERVWVTTPYYAPHRKLVKALVDAAKRGVDVRIIAGSVATTDPFWMWYASQYLSRRLLRAGVKIYEFHGGQILHAKTVAVDSRWASVGSYNWDVMSNKLLEVCVTEDGPQLVAQVEEHFERDLVKARPISMGTYDGHSWLLRLLCWAAYHFMLKAERVTFWSYRDPDLTSRLDN